jgi:glycosyltransferase involved in cell wall biosynthesis
MAADQQDLDAVFPASALDREFYLRTYEDVAKAGVDPWEHYRRWGHKEGRLWAAAARPVDEVLQRRPAFLLDLLAEVPAEARLELLTGPDAFRIFRDMVHPDFYGAQLATGVAQGTPAPPNGWTVGDVLDHFVTTGMDAGLRPSVFFHERWYRESFERVTGEPVVGHPFVHWLVKGRRDRISPSPLFEEAFYNARHPDMAQLPYWSFNHYVTHGAYEAFRRATPVVRDLVADPTARARQRPLMLGLVLRDAGPEQLRQSSPLEGLALHVARKRARLDSPVMREIADKAYRIEPLVRRPYGPRDISVPPLINHASELARRSELVRQEIGLTSVDTIVLVPHVRMAGSARVAGVFARTLRELGPDETILVLTTDAPTFERPDWFGSDVLVGDLSEHLDGLPEEAKTRLLLDVVRGLQPRRVMNINSRRAWELYRLFGRQLAAMTSLYAYLFTWDLDPHGNKGGYPISFFPECFGNLAGVLVDSAPLRDELVMRYGHSQQVADRIVLVHTPYERGDESIDHSSVFAARRAGGRKRRVIWCGRFDRQKRFDVVVEVALAMPDVEFWVWGKTVLGGLDVDLHRLPANISLQGTYEDFDDLPFESADLFLYTAEWDGVPTILIDAGVRGIAVVASAVGGVVDLIDEETGYPVVDFGDAGAYVKTIEAMTADPVTVTRRAAALRERVLTVCAPRRYADVVGRLFPPVAAPAASEPTGEAAHA